MGEYDGDAQRKRKKRAKGTNQRAGDGVEAIR